MVTSVCITGGSLWGYRLVASGDGTDVTESFELSGFLRPYWIVMGHWRGRTNRRGMTATLEAIKSVVEQESAAR